MVSPGSSTSGRRYCRVTVQGGKRTVLVTYHTFAGGQTQSVVRGF